MALPTSFEHPEDYFQDCLAFLKEYQYLYNFPNTDILVHDVLKHIDVQNMQTLEVFHKDFKLPTDLLNNFFEKLSRLTAVHDEFEEVDNLENVVNIPCGVSPKKRHEIAYLANEVKQVCEKNGCDVVVDFGSGLGYLDQIIFETTNLKVLGLECNTSHYVGAKKRQGKYHPNSVENVKYIKHTINENSNVSIEQYLRDNCKLKRNTRKAVKTKTMNRNFETYIQDACNGFRLILNEPVCLENREDSSDIKFSNFELDELRSIWQEIESSLVLKKAAIFILLQNYLQPVIENLILYDRLVYLREKGLKNCKLKKVVNERISPRCMALLAYKNINRIL
ncbi:hypothetical protein MSG28_014925 [Choristoneura fumiferana]|uniref:Uncharacterized protein n=1 Tax=Choristoneura fumiferana TaxID=7141 RepID=A0ACC0KY80_CHOFU|nr:hypothetical protein MSG28_014925 [Choristoneura fumiferana]